MSNNEIKALENIGVPLADWLPEIAPTLKNMWPDRESELVPVLPPLPTVTDWLTLLHLTDANPAKVLGHLSEILHDPKSGLELQNSWLILTKLFAVTFEAIEHHAADLAPGVWPTLVQIQNQVLQMAANKLLVRQNRPSTDILTRRANYLHTITEINKKIITTRDIDALMEEIVVLTKQSFNYEYVFLYLLNKNEQTLTLNNVAGLRQHTQTVDMRPLSLQAATITTQAITQEKLIFDNDLGQTRHPKAPDIKAQISVPLKTDHHLFGVLDVADSHPHAFSKDDCQIVQGLADHIAVALKNVRLQQTLQRHLKEQTLLYESNEILGTSLDAETVMRLITQTLVEVLDAGACVMCEIDKKAQIVTALAEHVLSSRENPVHTWRPLQEPVPLAEDPVSQQVLKTTRPVIYHDSASGNDVSWRHIPDSELGWGTVLALPFEIKKRTIGTLEIYDRDPSRTFSSDDIQLSQIMITQAGLALERARLFDETRRRLTEISILYTMSQRITGNLELQGVMDEIVVTLRQVIGCRGCCIFLLDATKEQLEIRAADGLKPQWREMAKLRVGEGAAGQAVAQGQTIYIPNIQQDPNSIMFDDEVHCLMVTPLFAHGEIIGTINVDHSHPNAFGQAQEQLLNIAATQVGIAIENARLFAKISAEQQQTQAIIQYMADGLLVTDSQGTIVTSNPALATMLNISRDEIIGQVVDSPDLPANLRSLTGNITYLARTGVLAKEVTIETPTEKTLRIFSTRMVDDDRTPFGEVRVVHDVTKEHRLEHLKNDFMSTISHELRTPLFSIQGFIQILLEDEQELTPELRKEFLTTIHTQIIQLSEMVNNLLDVFRFDEGKLDLIKRQVNIQQLIEQTCRKLLGFAHQQKITLTTKLPDVLPLIMADAERLEQVLTNLIGNAIKFTPETGQVFVTASTQNNEIWVEVKDSGIGIPPEAQEEIFSRYYQVKDQEKPSAKGSGLGLHIARKIVEGHEGRIWVDSTPKQGSTFYFALPISIENNT